VPRSLRELLPAGKPVANNLLPRALHVLLDVQLLIPSMDGRTRESAVPWPCLRALGMTEANVRELLAFRHLEHYLETTGENSPCRTFVTAGGRGLTLRSCLVLTTPGIAYARQLVAGTPPGQAKLPARPDWDREAGELWWERRLVNRFRHDAANQSASCSMHLRRLVGAGVSIIPSVNEECRTQRSVSTGLSRVSTRGKSRPPGSAFAGMGEVVLAGSPPA
jgi:hypothetical protein